LLATKNNERLLKDSIAQVAEPEAFLKRVRHLQAYPEERARDEIWFKDGRVLDRYSAPLVLADGKIAGRIWYFRDISERKRAETEREQLITGLKEALANVKALSGLIP